jgi:magnesium chelatase accessory protein
MTLSGACPTLEDAGRNWPFRDASRMVRVSRLDWHVQSLGDPEAPVALLVHGAALPPIPFAG